MVGAALGPSTSPQPCTTKFAPETAATSSSPISLWLAGLGQLSCVGREGTSKVGKRREERVFEAWDPGEGKGSSIARELEMSTFRGAREEGDRLTGSALPLQSKTRLDGRRCSRSTPRDLARRRAVQVFGSGFENLGCRA